MWRSGDHILMRYGRDGRFFGARPLTVVEDRPEYLAAWLAPGTPVANPVLADGSPIRSVPLHERWSRGRSTVLGTWEGEGILKLIPRAAAHSIWLFWDDDGSFAGWYVNLEQRHRWWSGGLDTRDHTLDVWVTPDRRWELKDEKELEASVDCGHRTTEEAAEIRAEARRVIAKVEAWASPFRDGWEDWRPEPRWPVPELPEGWNAPDAA